MKLSIIIPAYNEESRVSSVLKNYYSFFKDKLKKDFEIIVIPNNCSDDTVEIAQKFCKDKLEISFFEIKGYSGKGGAVMKGFDLAKGDLIGFVDADKSTSPKEFFKLYENIGKDNGIIGSRKIKGAKIIPKRTWRKNLSSWGFNAAVRTLFGLKYKDTQCGAKIFRKKVAKTLAREVKEAGWSFDVEVLNLCKKRNYKIQEFPILWQDDDGSHISGWDGIISIFKIIKYRFTF